MNKTTDGRFIDKRVSIDKKILKEIILNAKSKQNLSWKKFANKIGVVEQTLRHDWIKKENTIPLTIFTKLIKMSSYKLNDFKKDINLKESFWGQKLNKKEKKVKIPEIYSKEFAEFYGIMLGDGCIFSNKKGIAISGDNILDKIYFESYIKNLIYKLFKTYPSFYISKKYRSMNCILYSIKINKFLTELGFPRGLKSSGNMKIPSFIFNEKELLAPCLRGIMDTDGSLSYHLHSKIMIHLSITNKGLRNSVLEGLKNFGIKGGEFNKGIMIYGEEKIKVFRKEIGFSNHKNILKYEKFIKTRKLPSSKEIETFLMQ